MPFAVLHFMTCVYSYILSLFTKPSLIAFRASFSESFPARYASRASATFPNHSYEKRTYINNNIRNKYLNKEYEGIPEIKEIDFERLINKMSSEIRVK